MKTCDVLVLGPHPDDIEIACAGTILQLVAAGRRVSVLDLTRGEMGSRGTADERGRLAVDQREVVARQHGELDGEES